MNFDRRKVNWEWSGLQGCYGYQSGGEEGLNVVVGDYER